MNIPIRLVVQGLTTVVAVLSVFGLALRPAAAQSVESESVKAKLSLKVHLRLGKTTAEKFAAAVSEQIGLKIEPAQYLLDREMIAQLDNVSARAALNALSEINDWKWKETPDHAISIARNILQPAPVPAAIPRIVQSAMPKDIRVYLHIPTPSDDLNVYSNPILGVFSNLNNSRVTKGMRFLRDSQSELFSSLSPVGLNGAPIPFDKLNDAQQHNLIVQIAFKQLIMLDEYLLSDFLPYVYDPRSARLEAYGEDMMVHAHADVRGQDGSAGFSAKIQR